MGGFPGAADCLRSERPCVCGSSAVLEQRADLLDDPRSLAGVQLRRPGLSPRLQVQDAVADLLGAALVPELGSDVSAGTARHVELLLVAVAALRALPHELAVVLDDLDLAVVAAFLAVVATWCSAPRT